jgi:hypothetical protein
MSDTPTLKDWHTEAERLGLSVHRAITALGGIDDGVVLHGI